MRRKELPGRTAMIMACPAVTNRLKQPKAIAARYDKRATRSSASPQRQPLLSGCEGDQQLPW